jgi:multidrug resistance efflux pump
LPALHLEIDDLETRLAEANAAVDQLRAAMSTAQESHREERAMRDVFEARVSAMESSKFWKLRTVWFRLKRALRLTSGG